jgi:hypothetical protein
MERGQREHIRRNAVQLLDSLGSDRDQVARRLEDSGVLGTPSDPQGCAVAAYLMAVVGSDPEVRSVHVSRSDIIIDTARWWRPRVVVRLPEAVRRFVSAFDERQYPRLLRAGVALGRRGGLQVSSHSSSSSAATGGCSTST